MESSLPLFSASGVTVLAAAVAVALILLLVWRPSLTGAPGGKALAFLAFFLLPVGVTALGLSAHVEKAKTTDFCLSCHEMAPYGESLRIDDSAYVPASHFQNRRIPREQACYTCHTTYTMFGGVEAKLQGLRHLYVHYLGEVPKKIELYKPYSNRECLHCHAGARAFESSDLHKEIRADLTGGQTSCLECHDSIHDAARVGELAKWEEAK
jgi:cytochrome c-type protein NapC